MTSSRPLESSHAAQTTLPESDLSPPLSALQQQALDQACASIAPCWPLDRLIAVSPYWCQRDQPIDWVAARLSALANIQCLMPPDQCLERHSGHQAGDLYAYLDSAAEPLGVTDGYRSLDSIADRLSRLPHWHNISDLADAHRDLHHRMAWRDEIVQQISQFCAAYFQEDGSLNPHCLKPPVGTTLYQHWRTVTCQDKGIALLMGEPGLQHRFRDLPTDRDSLLATASNELGVAPERLEDYALALLLDINGWAAWVAYQDWQDALGEEDARTPGASMQDLLAVRLAWELVIWRHLQAGSPDQAATLGRQWQAQQAALPSLIDRHWQAQRPLWVWQLASEQAFQHPLNQALGASLADTPSPRQAALQAVFCIDVRSEPLRRALEQQSPGIQTLGFAGFFGLPLAHRQRGAAGSVPHLPGLLAPGIALTSGASEGAGQAAGQRHWQARLQEWGRAAASTFTAVEALGLLYAGKLLRRSLGQGTHQAPLDLSELTWCWQGSGEVLSIADKASLAGTVLRAMGLADALAPRVLLVGHGSGSCNNPHAAGLECGACGGQSGEVSVVALARLLNDSAVRERLAADGMAIGADCRFVPALHDTMTDQIKLLEGAEALSAEQHRWLLSAGEQARQKRAPSLGLDAASITAQALQQRQSDWSQTRPEWGLANNAGFIAAPRRITESIDLEGRCFLHDYDWRKDPDSTLLEQIMTAPLVVAHWINMQYNSSTTDNLKLGSGNKVLHNVVGGHIGVFEGNGGDLRIGLPLQSLHDGSHWRHTPNRLSVYLMAPAEAIHAIIARHAMLQSLTANRWLHLFRLDEASGKVEAYGDGGFAPVAEGS